MRSAVLGGLGVLVGVGVFGLVRYIDSPWRALPEDRIVAYTTPKCGTCRMFVDEVRAGDDPELGEVIPIPVAPGSVDPDLCARASQMSRWSTSRALLPKAVYCRWLVDDARDFYMEHFSGVPSFSINGEPLAQEHREALLKRAVASRRGRGGTSPRD